MQYLNIENLLQIIVFLSFCILLYVHKAAYWKARCETLEEIKNTEETDNLLEECRYWRRKDNPEATEFAKDAREYR